MALGPRLDLRQSQSLVMTPQLQQAIRLLAASNLELEAHVAAALDANPLLEMGEVRQDDAAPTDGNTEAAAAPEEREADALMQERGASDAAESAADSADQPTEADNPLDIGSNALDPEKAPGDADWGQAANSGGAAGSGSSGGDDGYPDLENHAGSGVTLAQHLEDQVGAASYGPKEAIIAMRIIGELDEAGYFTADMRQLAQDLGVLEDEIEDALLLVQSLDPTGVGARSLSECLMLQAKEVNRYDPAMARLIDNLDLLGAGEVARLKRMCQVDEDDFADMLAELRNYDPKPGFAFGDAPEAAIVPDVLITRNTTGGKDGAWDIRLNEDSLPRLVVNREYYVELREGCDDKESRSWLKEHLTDANWLIRALDQRQKTILKVAAEIVKRQAGFFREGVTAMKPLILREVADAIEMHESTVSRVTSNKFLACPRGTFELKYFFSSGVAASDGEGASSEAIKARIKALTDAEDPKKVLSDQKLVDLLKEEGFDLARRTVAKYREAAGIGSSAQRRRAKKLNAL